MTSAPPTRLGTDVGGTFTDLVLDDGGTIRVAKVPSTPADQTDGMLAGMARLGVTPADLDRFAHGTTVATNTVLERDGARTVLITTAGFRDLLTIGRQDRPSLYDQTAVRPAPLVPPARTVEATERIGAHGEVVTALTDDEVSRVAAAVRDLAPEAVAICLLFAFDDDDHERRIADALADLGVQVSRSSDVLPTFREYERASTTTLNAYVAPRMHRYLGSLAGRLAQGGYEHTVEVMRSGGGTFAAPLAARYPVTTLLSGPAAGAWGAAAVARVCGHEDVIAFDMGGTSTDVTLISGGRPTMTSDGRIGGLPFAVPTTEIHTVGAGGGSIAWMDPGGALRVGPRSAGAVPGPACYGRGGTAPTVTDANVHLGHLDPETRLGGAMPLEADLASAALADVAAALDQDLDAAARGVLRVVEAEMVRALRVVSVEKGRDPREFALVPFGGAGPLHQGALARELGCRSVLVPPHAGVLSALGLLAAPAVVDEAATRLTLLADTDPAGLARAWEQLADRARRRFTEQGTDVAALHRSADLRYRGQAFELTVASDAAADADALAAAFHAAHRDRYGYAQSDAAIELVTLRVRAEGPQPDLPLPPVTGGGGADDATLVVRRLAVDGSDRDVPVVARDRLGTGASLRGPAVVVGLESTCWVEPWQHLTVDDVGGLVLTEAGT